MTASEQNPVALPEPVLPEPVLPEPVLPEPVLRETVLPAGLRARVLEASWQARAAGRPVPDVPRISPAEAYSRAADALYGMLCALDDAAWGTPVLRGLDVQQLIGHLTGVEEDMRRGLAGDPAVADADHVGSTDPWAARQAGKAPGQTRAQWRRAADRTLAVVRDLPDTGTAVALHGMRLPLRALLVVRAFELWTHDNDIRRATGLPPAVPDAPTLRLMTELAARLLPRGALRAGLRDPMRVHLVLTGPGGGTWDVVVGDAGQAAPAPVGIVTGAVGFCRLVANRATPADLDLHITGDASQAARLLAAASTLALD